MENKCLWEVKPLLPDYRIKKEPEEITIKPEIKSEISDNDIEFEPDLTPQVAVYKCKTEVKDEATIKADFQDIKPDINNCCVADSSSFDVLGLPQCGLKPQTVKDTGTRVTLTAAVTKSKAETTDSNHQDITQDVECLICHEKFNHVSEYTEHFDLTHTKLYDVRYDCSHCEDCFTYRDQQNHHEEMHRDKVPVCPLCWNPFGDWGQRDSHLHSHYCDSSAVLGQQNSSTDDNIMLCTFCRGYASDNHELRIKHVFNAHRDHILHILGQTGDTAQKGYKCPVCSYVWFATLSTFELHFAQHFYIKFSESLEPPKTEGYRCRNCQFTYASLPQLRDHPCIAHVQDSDTNRVVCAICNASFESCSKRDSHFWGHFIRKYLSLSHLAAGFKYKCLICNQDFSQSGQASTHVRVQHGRKLIKEYNRMMSSEPSVPTLLTPATVKTQELRKRKSSKEKPATITAKKPREKKIKLCEEKESETQELRKRKPSKEKTATLTAKKPREKKIKINDELLYECAYCEFKCPVWLQFKSHLSASHSVDLPRLPFLCHRCTAPYSTWQGLDDHFLNHFIQVIQYKCCFCKKSHKTRLMAQNHLQLQHGKELTENYNRMTFKDMVYEIQQRVKSPDTPRPVTKEPRNINVKTLSAECGSSYAKTCEKGTKESTPQDISLISNMEQSPIPNSSEAESSESGTPATKSVQKKECILCQKVLGVQKVQLWNHLALEHNAQTVNKTVYCHLCDQVVAFLKLKFHHKDLHKDEDFRCQECGFVCKSWNNLAYHFAEHFFSTKMVPPSRGGALQCAECPRRLRKWSKLCEHLSKVHSLDIPPKPFACSKCRTPFSSFEQMDHHFITHFIVEIRQKQKLLKSKHSSEIHQFQLVTYYQCGLCDKLFSEPRFVRKHLESNHATELQQDHSRAVMGEAIAQIQQDAKESQVKNSGESNSAMVDGDDNVEPVTLNHDD